MADSEERNGGSDANSGFALRGLKPEVLARFREAVNGAGGNQAVADRAGISVSTLNKAVRGETQPRAEAMAAFVRACGRSLDWIFFGEERAPLAIASEAPAPALSAPEKETPPVNQEALQGAVMIVEEWLALNRRTMTPDKKARAVTMMYQLILEDTAAGAPAIDTHRAGQFLRLVG